MTKGGKGAGPRFDVAALGKLAGDAVFARGAAYAKQGRVRILSLGPGPIRAEVTGTEVYTTAIEGAGAAISGRCQCPAFADWGFCKHLVALALTLNAMTPADLAEAAGRQDRVGAYVRGLGAEVLAEWLLAWARRDPALWRELEFDSALASEDEGSLFARLTAAIDQAVAAGEGRGWRGAGTLAEDLAAVLDQVGRIIAAGRGELALRILDRLFEDTEEIFEAVDDSDGEVGGALAAARDLHLAACLAAPPDPVQLAGTLFERELDCEYGLWEDVREAYAEVLGAAGLAEYRRLAEAAWRAAGGKRAGRSERGRLRDILDGFAQSDGDIDARIALRAVDAASAWDYLQIAELCLAAGRDAEALRWAEDGAWATEDQPDRRLTMFTARLHRRLGDPAKARDLLWSAFERGPSLDLYRLLAEDAGEPDAVTDRAAATLAAAIAGGGKHGWSGLPDLLVRMFLEAGRPGEAWAAAQAHGCGDGVLADLAGATEASHPRDALGAYAALAERRIARADAVSYAEAVGLVARMARLRAGLGQAADHAAYVESLAQRHKAKRSFIKLLDPRRAPGSGG